MPLPSRKRKNVDKTRVFPYKMTHFWGCISTWLESSFHLLENAALQYDDLIKNGFLSVMI